MIHYDRDSEETKFIDASSYDVLDRTFMRYSTACDRQFHFALHELQRIRARRNGQSISSMTVDVINDKDE